MTSRHRTAVGAVVAAAVAAGVGSFVVLHRSVRIEGVRNVVLISIDTCRADRLSCYGFKRETTPHIDAVAREGVLFRQALTPVPLTTAAHSSMLTGTYPPTHGVHLNNGIALAATNVTLAEVLREGGFRTAAFVGGFPLDPQFGLNQGFETYDFAFTKTSETTAPYSERSAEEVTRPALAWLDQHNAGPFFLFLHYYDPHLPYQPPPPYASAYADDPYAGEIAYVDQWIGRLVDRLRALHVYDDTLLIITADHGESLGDHGEKSHGFFVYQSTQHVPLVIRAPGNAKGSRVEGRVSLVDLMPTVLDLTGLNAPERVQGTSLRAGLERRKAQDGARPLYCESLEATQFACSALHGLVEGAWKYIRTPRQELYDLANDPAETRNLFASEQPRAERMRDRLQGMLDEMEAAAPQPSAAKADPDAVKRLQSLGYVGGGALPSSSAFTPGLQDPKDFVATFERLEKANALFNSNKHREAEAELLDLVATQPGLIAAHEQLAQIARRERRLDDTVARCERIVELLLASASPTPQLAEARFNLAVALREMGREAEAIAQYEQALRVEPEYVDALNSLGLALARAGKYEQAIAQYERALRIEPDQPQVHNNFGNALRQTGHVAEAIGHYEEALKVKPDSVSALTNLALIRAADGEPKHRNGVEAVRLAERACEVTGRDNIGCLDTLAAAYAEALRFDDAVATAEKALALAYAAGQDGIADPIRSRVALYRVRKPFRTVTIPEASKSK